MRPPWQPSETSGKQFIRAGQYEVENKNGGTRQIIRVLNPKIAGKMARDFKRGQERADQ